MGMMGVMASKLFLSEDLKVPLGWLYATQIGDIDIGPSRIFSSPSREKIVRDCILLCHRLLACGAIGPRAGAESHCSLAKRTCRPGHVGPSAKERYEKGTQKDFEV